MNKFYITTPVYYVNDRPHLGHAYTTIAADILARWHKLRGDDVFFLVGTDEHGEKIEKAAKEAGKTPKEFVDGIVGHFKSLWKKLDISYDDFIRTTDERHEKIVTKFVENMTKKGDIYKGEYEGWYCVPDESFWTELQLKNGKCPQCGRVVQRIKEESYFFRLSKYQEKLLEFYRNYPEFLSPKSRAKEIVNRVKNGLKDVSITRTSVKWAIPFPSDSKHTIYVWIDALINYVSALGWPGPNFKKFWPADVHLIGKEINWFHSVIWPAMLFSAGLETPKRVFSHGWWTVNGQKMSKSLGNAINPVDVVEKYSVDSFRYFVMREMPLGDDGDFSEKALVARINGELVADLGNLIYRVLTLAERFDGKIDGKPELDKHLDVKKIDGLMEKLDLYNALGEILEFVRAGNKYITENEPWKLKGKELGNVLYNLVNASRIIAILIHPFMPETAEKINRQLGTKLGTLKDCKFAKFEGKIQKGDYLFKKIEDDLLKISKISTKTEPVKSDLKPQDETKTMEATFEDFEKIEMRTGKIIAAEKVEKSDKLLKLQVDFGSEKRQCIAGIQNYYSPDEIVGKIFVFVTNLKPRKLMGLESQCMILAAHDDTKGIALLRPEKDIAVGGKIG